MIEAPVITIKQDLKDYCDNCGELLEQGDVVYVCKFMNRIYCSKCDATPNSSPYICGVKFSRVHTHFIHEVKIENDQKNN